MALVAEAGSISGAGETGLAKVEEDKPTSTSAESNGVGEQSTPARAPNVHQHGESLRANWAAPMAHYGQLTSGKAPGTCDRHRNQSAWSTDKQQSTETCASESSSWYESWYESGTSLVQILDEV